MYTINRKKAYSLPYIKYQFNIELEAWNIMKEKLKNLTGKKKNKSKKKKEAPLNYMSVQKDCKIC